MAIVTSALLSLFVPPLAYVISGTVVALVTLRKGAAAGLQTMMFAMLVLILFCILANLPFQLAVAYALAVWLPVCAVAIVLRVTEAQGIALFVAGIMAACLIVSLYLMVDDVSGLWKNWFMTMLEKNVPDADMNVYEEALDSAAVIFNAIMAVGLMLNIVSSVLLARWWQSNLFNKGAFREEFYALRLPILVLPVSGLLVLLTFIASDSLQAISRDWLILMLFMYVIQGVSAVHRVIDQYKLSVAWLVAVYCLLILLPYITLLIACLGMTDVYLDWQKKQRSGRET